MPAGERAVHRVGDKPLVELEGVDLAILEPGGLRDRLHDAVFAERSAVGCLERRGFHDLDGRDPVAAEAPHIGALGVLAQHPLAQHALLLHDLARLLVADDLLAEQDLGQVLDVVSPVLHGGIIPGFALRGEIPFAAELDSAAAGCNRRRGCWSGVHLANWGRGCQCTFHDPRRLFVTVSRFLRHGSMRSKLARR